MNAINRNVTIYLFFGDLGPGFGSDDACFHLRQLWKKKDKKKKEINIDEKSAGCVHARHIHNPIHNKESVRIPLSDVMIPIHVGIISSSQTNPLNSMRRVASLLGELRYQDDHHDDGPSRRPFSCSDDSSSALSTNHPSYPDSLPPLSGGRKM